MKTHLATAWGLRKLTEAGIDGAPRDARLLIAMAAGIAPDRWSIERPDMMTPEQMARFGDVIRRRSAGEPVSKIIGQRSFWKHDFRVTADVLDPRPETEVLIAVALEAPFERVLDLGTGSGCILVSLLSEQCNATGVGGDISDAALGVARANAQAFDVSARAAFIISDWFKGIDGTFDLIVSNPPYIAANEMAGLSREVRDHDPRKALTDEGDGLRCYRIITAGAPEHLKPGGRLMVEIGPTQGADVADMFNNAGLQNVQTHRDLDGRDRVVSGTNRL